MFWLTLKKNLDDFYRALLLLEGLKLPFTKPVNDKDRRFVSVFLVCNDVIKNLN